MPKVTRIGNSLGVTIPREELDKLGLKAGDEVLVQVRGSVLEVIPVEKRLKLRPEVQQALDETIDTFGSALDRLAK